MDSNSENAKEGPDNILEAVAIIYCSFYQENQ